MDRISSLGQARLRDIAAVSLQCLRMHVPWHGVLQPLRSFRQHAHLQLRPSMGIVASLARALARHVAMVAAAPRASHRRAGNADGGRFGWSTSEPLMEGMHNL